MRPDHQGSRGVNDQPDDVVILCVGHDQPVLEAWVWHLAVDADAQRLAALELVFLVLD